METEMNSDTKLSLEYDFYGALLTKRQSEVMQLYHEENLSLSEIAEEFGISRQGVHDALKNAQEALTTYEEKLGLVHDLGGSEILEAPFLYVLVQRRYWLHHQRQREFCKEPARTDARDARRALHHQLGSV